MHEVRRQNGDVLATLAQGRQMQPHHVEAVEEVLAKLAIFHSQQQVLVGGGHDADVDLDLLCAADALETALLEHAQELDLEVGGQLADFVEKQGAAVGEFEAAALAGHGARERALFVAKELALQHADVEGHAVDRDEGPAGPGGGEVDGPGHELLARARLAGDKHRGLGGRGLVHHGQHQSHRLGLADDLVQPVAVLQVHLQQSVLLLGLGHLDGLGDREEQFLIGEGLGDVVEGADLHGLDRGLDGAVGGHDEHRDVGVVSLHVLEHVLPGELGHLHVGDDDVDLGLFEVGEAHFRVVERGDRVASLVQQGFDDQEVVGLVVEHEDRAGHVLSLCVWGCGLLRFDF